MELVPMKESTTVERERDNEEDQAYYELLEEATDEEAAELTSTANSSRLPAEVDEGILEFRDRTLKEFVTYCRSHRTVLLDFLDTSNLKEITNLADPGFFEDLLRHIQGYEVEGLETGDFRLPVFEVHRPKVGGCKTTAKLTTGSERKRTIGISLLGAKYGGHCKIEEACTLTREVNGDCCTFFFPARITFKKWIYPGVPSIQPLYTIKDIQISPRKYAIEPIIKGEHHCSLDPSMRFPATPDEAVGQLEVKSGAANDHTSFSVDRKLTRGKMVEFKIGLKTASHPDGIGSLEFSLETSVLVEYELAFDLAEGFDYTFIRGSRHSARIWCEAQTL